MGEGGHQGLSRAEAHTWFMLPLGQMNSVWFWVLYQDGDLNWTLERGKIHSKAG